MTLRAALLLLATLALQGCIALAAVPILASGGAIIAKNVGGERTRQAVAEGTEIDADEIELIDLANFTIVDASALPVPLDTGPLGAEYGDFLDFARIANADTGERFSVLLEDPTSLSPQRAQCDADIPAVLVDLDPADGLMPLAAGKTPDPQLVRALGDLRRAGIAIAWMTDREPTDAARIRELLAATRLDPTGRDPLFVQRYPGETKQARRRALLETHCLLAMAGDERADFDDVFTYLLDPTAAQPLEALIGSGWFLIPTPLD